LEAFHIIESTLREGEQFVGAQFTSDQKIQIARALDAFGVEYLELTSPLASPGSQEDCRTIANLGLRAKILTHTRCHLDDAKRALETGVDGIDMVIGTSSLLRTFSHGKSVDQVIELASEVLTWVRSQAPNIELRFSTEDSFRSNEADLFRVYLTIDRLGVVDRIVRIVRAAHALVVSPSKVRPASCVARSRPARKIINCSNVCANFATQHCKDAPKEASSGRERGIKN
jgi:homocitrate synthase